MGLKKNKVRKPMLLSHTRPPTAKTNRAALSSKATRNLIRTHHRLLKRREQAQQAGDQILVAKLDAEIKDNGGLESYQLASKLGQSMERGGDSSKVLVDWISPKLRELADMKSKFRVLEVGALSTKNACSINPQLDVTRIDLNSQEPGILKQDFMERPLPVDDSDRFHIISLSLVLNYVSSPLCRGEMLKRCVAFLTKSPPSNASITVTPSLFLVLPLACVDNSRYLTESRLNDILSTLGFVLVNTKKTSKLIFQLWEHWHDSKPKSYKKEMLNPGTTRNNFAIVTK
ncbi:nucleolus protein [Aspergillus campestris IBT 28561]|uniref:25S rRNA adenine-N(1) methyltransferase n=1 Tax=Aspergillus campestris (strain IBT 28561) TaxID=1392248 RepID=A0A2I1D681_ASPC2|nr:nucleolus protein [Aspergillus campestris IBT 28561]PKY05363.1 nucleolus protein [Aspergillus campestris IBT 28561]